MVKKKSVKVSKKMAVPVKRVVKKKTSKKFKSEKTKIDLKKFPTLELKTESEIAMDFGVKAYKKFSSIIKSVILFGSVAKKKVVPGSDIDIVIIIDDVSVRWDQEMIAWYREELEKIVKRNPYQVHLHINTIKLSTWWEDVLRGDPVVLNVIRDGISMIDYGGFFEPLQYLLVKGKIRSTPEAIYSLLQRAPSHITRSKISSLNAIEGLYWSMVDASQAALIAANVTPSSPEHIPMDLKINFVDTKKLKSKYVEWYRELLMLHKKIVHGDINSLRGTEIEDWQKKSEEFLKVMVMLVKELVS